jgi:hypothetical protein
MGYEMLSKHAILSQSCSFCYGTHHSYHSFLHVNRSLFESASRLHVYTLGQMGFAMLTMLPMNAERIPDYISLCRMLVPSQYTSKYRRSLSPIEACGHPP